MHVRISSARLPRRGLRPLLAATLVVLLLSSARSLLDGGAAHAQGLGGQVNDTIALLIESPTALKRIGPGAYELQIPVTVSSTVTDNRLSISDGEDFGKAAQGRLHTAAGLVAQPLQTPVPGGAMASLASPVDPLLEHWDTPLAQQPATVVLRQSVARGVAPGQSAQKVLLITLSSTVP